tara:strand:+ start:289 stop:507 length:219 start_codon:yes stop_codon:yes gene_type:complete
MKYGQQLQTALDRLDQSLFTLRNIIKRGQTEEALAYMEKGELKERYEEMQNIINISQTNTLGARGTNQTGTY